MGYKEIFYPESAFGGFTDIDGTIAFYTRVNSLLKPSYTVLDVGCGRGAYRDDPVDIRRSLRILRGKVQTVIGIDVDESGRENPFIDEFRLVDEDTWPIDNGRVDLVLCDFVLEHVEKPGKFFSEARRVVRDNGCICLRTSNAWNYVGLLSRLTPNRDHCLVKRLVQESAKEIDVFPTVYRCNTIRRIRSMLNAHGFRSVVYGYEAEPSYLSFSKAAYWLGVAHQKLAPSLVKPAIFAFGRARSHALPGF